MAGPWEKYRTGQPQPVIPVRPDPLAVQREDRTAGNDAQRIALERQRLALAQQTAAGTNQRASQAAADAHAARQVATDVSARDRNARLGTLNALANQIGRVEQLYKTGPGSTKGIAGAMDYLPTPGNRTFDSAAAGLAEIGLNAFRTPGVGSQSDKELQAFVAANRPSAADYDEQIQQKLWNMRNRLSEAYKPYGVKYPTTQGAPRKPAASKGWKIERLD